MARIDGAACGIPRPFRAASALPFKRHSISGGERIYPKGVLFTAHFFIESVFFPRNKTARLFQGGPLFVYPSD